MMKLTTLLQLSLVWILILNNVCFCAKQDTEENVLTSAFKDEILNFRDTYYMDRGSYWFDRFGSL